MEPPRTLANKWEGCWEHWQQVDKEWDAPLNRAKAEGARSIEISHRSFDNVEVFYRLDLVANTETRISIPLTGRCALEPPTRSIRQVRVFVVRSITDRGSVPTMPVFPSGMELHWQVETI